MPAVAVRVSFVPGGDGASVTEVVVGAVLMTVAVSEAAQRQGVRRLVFAHIGRPMLRAIDQGRIPAFGEVGADDLCSGATLKRIPAGPVA